MAGGFTSICCMPNTKPPLDNEGQVEFVLREAQRVGLANVYPVGAITKGRQGKELSEIGSMLQRGAVAFSDDGVAVADPSVMRKALQYARMFDTLLMQQLRGADAGRRRHARRRGLDEPGAGGYSPPRPSSSSSRAICC